jgi:DNA-binding LytR/AlgR family response regulator
VSALDFLLKPIRYNKFITAVEKAREWFGRSQEPHTEEPAAIGNQDVAKPINTVFLKVDGEYRQVALDKILYVCGMKDYVMFYVEGERKPLITHLTMKSVEEMLPASRFLRVHRSYIVALDKIRSVDRNDCIYIGDEIIRVTDAFKETFNQFLQSRFPGN